MDELHEGYPHGPDGSKKFDDELCDLNEEYIEAGLCTSGTGGADSIRENHLVSLSPRLSRGEVFLQQRDEKMLRPIRVLCAQCTSKLLPVTVGHPSPHTGSCYMRRPMFFHDYGVLEAVPSHGAHDTH